MSLSSQQPTIVKLVLEHHFDGFGIGFELPRLSWRFANPPSSADEGYRGWSQRAYEVEIRQGDLQQSQLYLVESHESVLVPWPGKALKPGHSSQIRVRCFGHGIELPTEWSTWTRVEAALLNQDDWIARPISAAQRIQNANGSLRPIRFRKAFVVPENANKARLYITCFGIYEAYLNGRRIGDHYLSPGWTSYKHRIVFQTFDVTSLLEDGVNVLSAEVGEGWFAGRMGRRGGERFNYGDEVALLAQLDIHTSESKDPWRICTDSSWKTHGSATLSSEIYNGEHYDATHETPGWLQADFDESSWTFAKQGLMPNARLVAQDAPPCRVTEVIKPISILTTKSGKTILDFGQNLVGVPKITKLPPRSQITLRHAEVLDNGELGTRPLRSAECTDVIISDTKEITNWTPKFTFHGFRYIQVDGWPSVSLDDISALVIHSDMRRSGWFTCSDTLVNRLHENVVWSTRGNFVSLPTDCPQRDERLGWTADLQVFAPTANFLYDTTGLLNSWLDDVAAEQLAHPKKIPGLVVPDVFQGFSDLINPQAVWHDVVVLTPWDIYKATGDIHVLRRLYPNMKVWVDEVIPRGPDRLWDIGIWQFGDWVDPAAPPQDPGDGRTDGVLVADAYLCHVTSVLSKISKRLGIPEDEQRYRLEAQSLKRMFAHKYITPGGNLANNTQAAIALALSFDLYPPEAIDHAAEMLARLVRSSRYRVSTGFAGTPVILPALTKVGKTNMSYRMLLEKHCPSWLYPVRMGATTIWERWDALLEDGSLNPGNMLSFNHYAFGSVASWLHATVGGISSDDGWKTVEIRPQPGGLLTHAEARFDGPYGSVRSSWTVDEGNFTLEVELPPNSTGKVTLPGSSADPLTVGSGCHSFICPYEGDNYPPPLGLGSYLRPGSIPCDCPP